MVKTILGPCDMLSTLISEMPSCIKDTFIIVIVLIILPYS